MGVLTGDQKKEPMHYGEIFLGWTHLLRAKGCLAKYQLLINHGEDKDLTEFINSMINEVIKPEIEKGDKLFKDNGIMPPPAPPEKAKVEAEKIPPGARFTDQEIATCVSHDIAIGLVECSKIIGISYREDIAMMFAKHHGQLVIFGGRLLKLIKEKGWLVLPPLHNE